MYTRDKFKLKQFLVLFSYSSFVNDFLEFQPFTDFHFLQSPFHFWTVLTYQTLGWDDVGFSLLGFPSCLGPKRAISQKVSVCRSNPTKPFFSYRFFLLNRWQSLVSSFMGILARVGTVTHLLRKTVTNSLIPFLVDEIVIIFPSRACTHKTQVQVKTIFSNI